MAVVLLTKLTLVVNSYFENKVPSEERDFIMIDPGIFTLYPKCLSSLWKTKSKVLQKIKLINTSSKMGYGCFQTEKNKIDFMGLLKKYTPRPEAAT